MAWNCNYIIVKNRSIDVAQQKNQNLLSLKTRTPYTCTSHVFDTFVLFKSCVSPATDNMETRSICYFFKIILILKEGYISTRTWKTIIF